MNKKEIINLLIQERKIEHTGHMVYTCPDNRDILFNIIDKVLDDECKGAIK